MSLRGVVTGGAGFLGSHVADVLAEAGHDITVVDLNLSAAHRSVVADLGDPAGLASSFRGAEFVCHLAAIGDVYLAGEKPPLAAKVNVVGTANVCEAALSSGVPALLYASTWEVYGAPKYQPLDEQHPTNPDHPYNITKLAGERIAISYGHLRQGLRVVALRLGTAYGTRMRPNSVFSIFVQRAKRREPITIQGTGDQVRQFTHARDIGRAFLMALAGAKSGAIYNVVSDESVTIRQLAEQVVAAIPTRLEFAPPRQGDVASARVSAARIEKDLGWRAQTRFRDGLAELITSYRVTVA